MKYVAYYRVHPDALKGSELTLNAQKMKVRTTVDYIGGGEILHEFLDHDDGLRREMRPSGLRKAIIQARKHSAVIVLSGLDRLSEKVSELSSVVEGADVVFVWMQVSNNKSVVQFFSSVTDDDDGLFLQSPAQKKGKFEQRIQSVLRSLRVPSKQGSPQNLTPAAQQKGVQAVKQKAIENEANKIATGIALRLRMEGKNLTEIASELNRQGMTTARGKQFQPVQVQRLLQRAETQHQENHLQPGLFDE